VVFFRCSIDLIFRPFATLRAVLNHPHRLAIGFGGLLTLSAVYIVVFSVCLAKNLPPLTPPVLRIPREEYFAYERFFIMPVAIASTILMAGIIRLAAGYWNGKGQFEALFALLGFIHVIVAIAMGLPDLALAILGRSFIGPHVFLGTIWYFLLVVVIVRELERLSWPKTVAVSFMGALANAAVQFVFTR
jgi:hypothetical protein